MILKRILANTQVSTSKVAMLISLDTSLLKMSNQSKVVAAVQFCENLMAGYLNSERITPTQKIEDQSDKINLRKKG